jgi:capsular polysaccharide transport system permease protein
VFSGTKGACRLSEQESPKRARARRRGKAQPKPSVAEPQIIVRPVARPASFKGRHINLTLSFVLCVIIPTFLVGLYMGVIARDQYVSEVAFSVRSAQTPPALELLGGISTLGGADTMDAEILYAFLQSSQIVSDINAEIDIKTKYLCPKGTADPLFCLNADATIEELVAYWNRMIEISYESGSGIIELSVRAFTPNEAKTIAEAAFARSGAMINELSDTAQADATRYANDELIHSVERLKNARRLLAEFRNETQIIDPSLDFQGQMGVISSLQEQLTGALIDRGLVELTATRPDPRLDQLDRKIDVIEQQIKLQRGQFGRSDVNDADAYPQLIGRFEELNVDVEFAEQAYIQALANLDSAQAEAQRQSRYLTAHVQPTLAETSEYPKRFLNTLLTGFFCFFTWLVGALVYYSLRERA